MPIYYLGANSTDSHRLSCFVTMGEYIHDNLFKISWASRNYMIYLKSTNSGGAILICLIIFGCTGYESKTTGDFLVYDGLLGCLLGLSTAYVIRSTNTCAIINISKAYN